MSKFSDRLSSLGQSAPAHMGFGRATSREKNPVMLVIGRGGADKDAGSVDLLLRESASGGTGDWGLVVDGSTNVDTEALEKDGCQFLVIESEDASAEVLLTEDLGIGMPVQDGLSEQRIRAIEDGPFDFLVYTPESVSWPLTVGKVLTLQDLVSSYSTHIFLQLPPGAELPGEKDLDVLKNLPVSALIVDLGAVKAADLEAMREAIRKLEPKKPSGRGDRSPLVPMAGRAAAEDADAGGSYEDDDDDWDD